MGLSIRNIGEDKSPTILTITARIKPAIGPLAPTSNKSSLLGGRDFCTITAPKVPIPKIPRSGGGPGIKYGGVASIPFLSAVNL